MGLNGSGGQRHDVDWVIIGSGFGGSVSALRLAEKGYSVQVLEQGNRINDEDMPSSTWDLRRYFFAPKFGLRGILRLATFKDVFVSAGTGVGGGSLGYAMTLYTPPPAFFCDPQWGDIRDWHAELSPHYETAQRMLGVTDAAVGDPADQLLLEYGRELGVEDTYRTARVGTYLDTPGQTVADPYFGGEGPARTGCTTCGRCMMGCPVGAKNSLPKNYLWFAERLGAKITPQRQVMTIRPLGEHGEDGWEIVHEKSGAWRRKDRKVIRARGIVISGGTLGTNELLAQARADGHLPHLSSRLGELVRTNSEAVLGVTVPPDKDPGLINRVAINSSIYPDPSTHIETVVYGKGGGAMRGLFTLLTGDGSRVTRPLKLVGQIVRRPKQFFSLMTTPGWSERTIIVLVMQSLDNAIRLTAKTGRNGRVKLQTAQDPEKPNPTFIPVANHFTEWLAERTGGVAASSIFESLFAIPSTAHFLGGVVVSDSPEQGVVDPDHRVHGYENLLVCDGSAVPANVGVNPSLTITAMSERAMAQIPVKDGAVARQPIGVAPIAGQTATAAPEPVAPLPVVHA
ncbi:MAG: GMC family oxidoreductase [Solirubrobacteraceae bacterium]|nr:GMC family oxidoreductase [Solirubrobacteraceae bacterium]